MQGLFLLRFDHAPRRAVCLPGALPDLSNRGLRGHPAVDEEGREHCPRPPSTRIAMDEHFLGLRELRLDEGDELVDLIEGRRREVLDADLLVLEASVLDLERVQTVALEAHDDGVSHLPETREVPFDAGRARARVVCRSTGTFGHRSSWLRGARGRRASATMENTCANSPKQADSGRSTSRGVAFRLNEAMSWSRRIGRMRRRVWTACSSRGCWTKAPRSCSCSASDLTDWTTAMSFPWAATTSTSRVAASCWRPPRRSGPL